MAHRATEAQADRGIGRLRRVQVARLPALLSDPWVLSVLMGAVVLVALLTPTAYLVVWSVTGTDIVGILDGGTLHWYATVLSSIDWWNAVLYSLLIAGCASALSLIIVTSVIYQSRQQGPLVQTLGTLAVVGPLLVPLLAYGLALRLTAGRVVPWEWALLLLGHTAIIMPVQYFVMEAGSELVHQHALENARMLGGRFWEIVFRVWLPQMTWPLSCAAAIGLLISFDEIVIATCVIDSSTVTVPKKLFDNIYAGSNPAPAVIAVLVTALSLGILSVLLLIRRRVHD